MEFAWMLSGLCVVLLSLTRIFNPKSFGIPWAITGVRNVFFASRWVSTLTRTCFVLRTYCSCIRSYAWCNWQYNLQYMPAYQVLYLCMCSKLPKWQNRPIAFPKWMSEKIISFVRCATTAWSNLWLGQSYDISALFLSNSILMFWTLWDNRVIATIIATVFTQK